MGDIIFTPTITVLEILSDKASSSLQALKKRMQEQKDVYLSATSSVQE